MNLVLDVISKRYSCRDFSDREISSDNLEAIANAAIASPSGMNRQYWHVSIVTNKELLQELDREGMAVMNRVNKAMYERIMGRGGKLFYGATAMAFIAIKEALPKGAELVDLGIVAQNISLAATSLGIDNCHCGLAVYCFMGERAEEFKEKLKLPLGYDCGIGVILGYANSSASPHVPDKSKVVFID